MTFHVTEHKVISHVISTLEAKAQSMLGHTYLSNLRRLRDLGVRTHFEPPTHSLADRAFVLGHFLLPPPPPSLMLILHPCTFGVVMRFVGPVASSSSIILYYIDTHTNHTRTKILHASFPSRSLASSESSWPCINFVMRGVPSPLWARSKYWPNTLCADTLGTIHNVGNVTSAYSVDVV